MSKVRIVEISLSVSLLIGILMSFNLWNSNREIPYCSISDSLNNYAALLSDVSISILLLLLILSLFFSKPIIKCFIILFLLLSVSIDINRLQPWVYIYILMFVFTFFNNKEVFTLLNIILFSSIYFWSGLHKINQSFLYETYYPLLKTFGVSEVKFFLEENWIGYALPVFEICLGIGLILIKTRRVTVYLIILFHFCVIIYLSPLIGNKNGVVIPWNLEMSFICFLIFYNNDVKFLEINKLLKKDKFILLSVFAFVGIFPVLNFFSLWDDYLSFSLYSAKNKLFYIAISDKYLNRLDESFRESYLELDKNVSGGKVVDMNKYFFSY